MNSTFLKTFLASLGVATAFVAQPVAASAMTSFDPYIGFGYGRTKVHTNVSGLTNGSIDEKDKGWKIFGGVEVNDYLAIEGSYHDVGKATLKIGDGGTITIGDQTVTVGGGDSVNVTLNGKSFGIAAKVGKKFGMVRPFAKVGFQRWRAKSSASDATYAQAITSNSSGTDLFYGVGFEFIPKEQLGISVEWERYDFGGIDVDAIGVGLRYKF